MDIKRLADLPEVQIKENSAGSLLMLGVTVNNDVLWTAACGKRVIKVTGMTTLKDTVFWLTEGNNGMSGENDISTYVMSTRVEGKHILDSLIERRELLNSRQ